MDEVCDYIKSICYDARANSRYSCEYIEFTACEEENLTYVKMSSYIKSELQNRLGADVANIYDEIVDDRPTVMFSYKGNAGKIWEIYNSRDYHFWVVSI